MDRPEVIDLYSLRSVADAAEELRVGTRTIRRAIERGRLRAMLVGHDYVTDIAAIEDYRRTRHRSRALTRTP